LWSPLIRKVISVPLARPGARSVLRLTCEEVLGEGETWIIGRPLISCSDGRLVAAGV
jgi:hypothetical protein